MSRYNEMMKDEFAELGALFVQSTEMKMKTIFYGLLEEIQENSAKGNETECLKLTAQKEILLELEKRLFN